MRAGNHMRAGNCQPNPNHGRRSGHSRQRHRKGEVQAICKEHWTFLLFLNKQSNAFYLLGTTILRFFSVFPKVFMKFQGSSSHFFCFSTVFFQSQILPDPKLVRPNTWSDLIARGRGMVGCRNPLLLHALLHSNSMDLSLVPHLFGSQLCWTTSVLLIIYVLLFMSPI
jgi:hypothetical protein